MFPFIRFTNWKQVPRKRYLCLVYNVSIHTLHELEARTLDCVVCLQLTTGVSIHTLHELEASLSVTSGRLLTQPKGFHSYASRIGSKVQQRMQQVTMQSGFHSYASRIGSKTSFAKLGCTRIVQRFFVGY